VDEIKSLLSRAILKGTADDLPAKLTLNVQFRGSSKRLLLDLLCGIVSRLPVPNRVSRSSSLPPVLMTIPLFVPFASLVLPSYKESTTCPRPLL
jgi:hypothetical protein